MTLDQNLETRKATLKIPDRKERKHREMWGEKICHAKEAAVDEL